MMMERCCKRYEFFPTRWQTSGEKNVPARLPLCFQPSFLLTWSIVAVWHQNASLIHNSPRERKRGAGKTKEREGERVEEKKKKTQRKEQNKVWVKVWRKKGKNKDTERKLGSRREEGGIARRGYTVWAKKMMIKERKSRLRLSDVALPEEEGFQSGQIASFFFSPLLACHR